VLRVAVPAYAIQRVFLHASGYLFGPALGCAVAYLTEGDLKAASISAGVSALCFCYFMAFRESRDTTPRK
jgi:hypothetical protein